MQQTDGQVHLRCKHPDRGCGQLSAPQVPTADVDRVDVSVKLIMPTAAWHASNTSTSLLDLFIHPTISHSINHSLTRSVTLSTMS